MLINCTIFIYIYIHSLFKIEHAHSLSRSFSFSFSLVKLERVMMGQGRRSSSVAQAVATILLALLCLLLNGGASNAATYTVGGSNGWAVGVTSWPNGKKFQAGDVLGEPAPDEISKLTYNISQLITNQHLSLDPTPRVFYYLEFDYLHAY